MFETRAVANDGCRTEGLVVILRGEADDLVDAVFDVLVLHVHLTLSNQVGWLEEASAAIR